MPLVEESMFIDAVKKCVVANGKFVPPAGRGALYVRPLLIASGIALSNIPDEYTLCIYCSPVGSYFKSGGREAVGIKVMVSESYNRSVIGGVGAVKMPGNYAPTFLPKKFAAEKGFDEVRETRKTEDWKTSFPSPPMFRSRSYSVRVLSNFTFLSASLLFVRPPRSFFWMVVALVILKKLLAPTSSSS